MKVMINTMRDYYADLVVDLKKLLMKDLVDYELVDLLEDYMEGFKLSAKGDNITVEPNFEAIDIEDWWKNIGTLVADKLNIPEAEFIPNEFDRDLFTRIVLNEVVSEREYFLNTSSVLATYKNSANYAFTFNKNSFLKLFFDFNVKRFEQDIDEVFQNEVEVKNVDEEDLDEDGVLFIEDYREVLGIVSDVLFKDLEVSAKDYYSVKTSSEEFKSLQKLGRDIVHLVDVMNTEEYWVDYLVDNASTLFEDLV